MASRDGEPSSQPAVADLLRNDFDEAFRCCVADACSCKFRQRQRSDGFAKAGNRVKDVIETSDATPMTTPRVERTVRSRLARSVAMPTAMERRSVRVNMGWGGGGGGAVGGAAGRLTPLQQRLKARLRGLNPELRGSSEPATRRPGSAAG